MLVCLFSAASAAHKISTRCPVDISPSYPASTPTSTSTSTLTPTISTNTIMSLNSHFDGLNVAPTFTVPAQQTYGSSSHTLATSEDPQALPRQLVSVGSFRIGVRGRAQRSRQNEWTSLDMLAFDQAGPSQLSVQDPRHPLGDEHMSSFLSLAVDMSGDTYPANYAVSSGPSDEAAWGAEMELEVCGYHDFRQLPD